MDVHDAQRTGRHPVGARTYVAPAQLGEELLAAGEELTHSRRSGTYDVRVSTRGGKLVALALQYAIIGPQILTA